MLTMRIKWTLGVRTLTQGALTRALSRAIPPIEWSAYVPDIEAILRLKRERDAAAVNKS